MTETVEIRAVVRTEMVDRVVHRLRESGCPRMIVTPVHAIGAGVDPEAAKVSLREGSEFADKALVQFICSGDRCEMYAELIADAARTGRRGDGFISMHPVGTVVNIRTGARSLEALG